MANETNLFEEGLYAGLGLALRAKDRVEEFARKISEEHKMNEEQGKRFLDDLVNQSEETKSRLDEMIANRLEAYMEEAGVPKKDDIDKLADKIDKLEKKVSKS